MSAASEAVAAKLLISRLAKFDIRLSEADAAKLIVLCRAQGWKFTCREATDEMRASVDGTKFGEGSGIQSVDVLWTKMWEQA